MARVGLYGGSFDPVHWGHVLPVESARQALALDRVLYLPTAEPPHKQGQRFAPASARFTMVELALLDRPALQVSDFEMRREASYTVETLEHFRAALPGDELFLLIGDDSWRDLASWRRYAELPALAEIVVMARPPEEDLLAGIDPVLRAAVETARVHFHTGPEIPLASRELRRAWASGEEPGPGQVPPLVLDYLRKYGLYR